jgi:uncharacterized protein (TIGR00730 family)
MQPKETLARTRGIVPMLKFLIGLLYATLRGLLKFRNIPQTITIYGSARLSTESKEYHQAYTLAFKLAKAGLPVMTGGGPSIMEAASKGSLDACGQSYGCNIVLPYEQTANPHMSIQYETDFFFVRKFLLRHTSIAFIAFPGGFGTLDEIFENITLIRTKSCEAYPIILVGKAYWKGLIQYLQDTQVTAGTISQSDLDQITLTDDLDEVLTIIQSYAKNNK